MPTLKSNSQINVKVGPARFISRRGHGMMDMAKAPCQTAYGQYTDAGYLNGVAGRNLKGKRGVC